MLHESPPARVTILACNHVLCFLNSRFEYAGKGIERVVPPQRGFLALPQPVKEIRCFSFDVFKIHMGRQNPIHRDPAARRLAEQYWMLRTIRCIDATVRHILVVNINLTWHMPSMRRFPPTSRLNLRRQTPALTLAHPTLISFSHSPGNPTK